MSGRRLTEAERDARRQARADAREAQRQADLDAMRADLAAQLRALPPPTEAEVADLAAFLARVHIRIAREAAEPEDGRDA